MERQGLVEDVKVKRWGGGQEERVHAWLIKHVLLSVSGISPQLMGRPELAWS